MPTFKRRIRNLLESITGYDIERAGDKSIVFINPKHRADAWFSHAAQLRSIFEELNIDLVIDVGANEGQFARNLRDFYQGEIHSFEPGSSVFEKLSSNASSDSNWHVHKFALGSREATETLNVSSETSLSSFLETNNYSIKRFGDEAITTTKETVLVCRFDEVIDAIVHGIENRRIFIKMDTQGYDAEVFKGLGDKLKYVLAIQSEVALIPIYEGMPHWTESIALYEENGFGVIGMFPVTRDSLRVIEYDCLLGKVRV